MTNHQLRRYLFKRPLYTYIYYFRIKTLALFENYRISIIDHWFYHVSNSSFLNFICWECTDEVYLFVACFGIQFLRPKTYWNVLNSLSIEIKLNKVKSHRALDILSVMGINKKIRLLTLDPATLISTYFRPSGQIEAYGILHVHIIQWNSILVFSKLVECPADTILSAWLIRWEIFVFSKFVEYSEYYGDIPVDQHLVIYHQFCK